MDQPPVHKLWIDEAEWYPVITLDKDPYYKGVTTQPFIRLSDDEIKDLLEVQNRFLLWQDRLAHYVSQQTHGCSEIIDPDFFGEQ